MVVAGVDGCRGGWFLAKWNGADHWSFQLCHDFEGVVRTTNGCCITCVDMPIGLLDRGRRGGRTCEQEARQLLGPRRSSVFSAPSRQALGENTYEAAQRANYPVGLSQQAFALFPKLRDVDGVITQQLQDRIKEVHPELCFYAMNNNMPMQYSKRSTNGIDERMRLLVQNTNGWLCFYENALRTFPRNQVAKDDILDASAAAWTAYRISQNVATRIPNDVPRDSRGLSMEMWF